MSSYDIADWLISSGKYEGRGKPENVASLVRKILYRYRHSLRIDKEFEKIKQVNRIKRKIDKSPESKKDVYDWENLLRECIEEKVPLVDQSQHSHYTVVWEKKDAENSDRVSTSELSTRDSR